MEGNLAATRKAPALGGALPGEGTAGAVVWVGRGRREKVVGPGLPKGTQFRDPSALREALLRPVVTSLPRLSPVRQVHSVQVLQRPLLPLHHPEEHPPGDQAQV